MAEGNIPIYLVEPGEVVADTFGGAAPATETRHEVWAERRDIAGYAFTESRAVTAQAETVFRIKDFGGGIGFRPTTDWWIIDREDGDREYRIVRVHRVHLRGGARATYFDLYGSYRGVAA